MLKHLYIKNFALIDVLDIDFLSGFSVPLFYPNEQCFLLLLLQKRKPCCIYTTYFHFIQCHKKGPPITINV